jgi:TolA-binding protein
MTPAELHPDDLLERDAAGELSQAEQNQLAAHLLRCTACRLERLARADFRGEADRLYPHGPADAKLLTRVLATPEVHAGGGAPGAEHAGSRGRRRMQRIGGLLLTGTVLAAASWAAAARWSSVSRLAGARAAIAPAALRSVAAHGSEPGVLDNPPELQESPGGSEDVPGDPGAPLASGPQRPPAPAALAPPGSAAAELTRESAPGAFKLACEMRRSGRHDRAADLYRGLIARYPGSPEARASQIALGRMLLDDGDPASALRWFDDYLRAGGPLGEDVMLARAVALQRLSRTDEEAHAWAALLEVYPHTVHADRARSRLRELGTM